MTESKHKALQDFVQWSNMSKSMTFTAALKREEDGGYSVQCVELPAAVSQGETEGEAIRNIKEAIELVLEELEARANAQKPDKLEIVTLRV